MGIPIECRCGKRLTAKDDAAGRRVTCPACQSPIDVPAPAVAKARVAWRPWAVGLVALAAAVGWGEFRLGRYKAAQSVRVSTGEVVVGDPDGTYHVRIEAMPEGAGLTVIKDKAMVVSVVADKWKGPFVNVRDGASESVVEMVAECAGGYPLLGVRDSVGQLVFKTPKAPPSLGWDLRRLPVADGWDDDPFASNIDE